MGSDRIRQLDLFEKPLQKGAARKKETTETAIVESLTHPHPEFGRLVAQWKRINGVRDELRNQVSALLRQQDRTSEIETVLTSIDNAWRNDEAKKRRRDDMRGGDYLTDTVLREE